MTEAEIGALMGKFYAQREAEDKADKLERYRRLNKFVKPGQILFVGSSLMEQFPILELIEGERLPLLIYNRGIGGYTTSELRAALEPCVFDLAPKYIFINIGTNDLNGPDYEESELMARYEDILRAIRERLPDTKIFMLAYYPTCPEVGNRNPYIRGLFQYRTNERIASANRAVRELAGKIGAEFLDLNGCITDEKGDMRPDITVEGMHMYADGYKPILEALLPILRTLD